MSTYNKDIILLLLTRNFVERIKEKCDLTNIVYFFHISLFTVVHVNTFVLKILFFHAFSIYCTRYNHAIYNALCSRAISMLQ